MCQERSTLQRLTDEVPQVQGPVFGLVEDGATPAAIVEFHHTCAPQALMSWHQLQSGRSWRREGIPECGYLPECCVAEPQRMNAQEVRDPNIAQDTPEPFPLKFRCNPNYIWPLSFYLVLVIQ